MRAVLLRLRAPGTQGSGAPGSRGSTWACRSAGESAGRAGQRPLEDRRFRCLRPRGEIRLRAHVTLPGRCRLTWSRGACGRDSGLRGCPWQSTPSDPGPLHQEGAALDSRSFCRREGSVVWEGHRGQLRGGPSPTDLPAATTVPRYGEARVGLRWEGACSRPLDIREPRPGETRPAQPGKRMCSRKKWGGPFESVLLPT